MSNDPNDPDQETLHGASLVAEELLSLLSFFGPGAIERDVLTRGASDVPEPLRTGLADPAMLDGAVAVLAARSLIEADGPRISLHPAAADLTRERMPVGQRRRWCEVALHILNDAFAFKSTDVGTWGRCAALVPHVHAVAAHAEALQAAPELVASLLNETGRFLLVGANYGEARVVLTRALQLARGVYGEKHPAVSAIVNNLGRVCQRQQDYDSARHYFEWALAIDEPAYGQEHPHVATVMNNYGLCLMATGNAQAAREHFEWALRVYARHYGVEHPKTASIVNNLGFALKALGDLMTAGDCFSRALAVVEKTAGPTHPDVASILHNLGSALRGLGKHAMARPYLERALSITQSSFSPTHPDVLRDVDQFGLVLSELRDLEAARRLYEQHLRLVQRVERPDQAVASSLRKALEDLGVTRV